MAFVFTLGTDDFIIKGAEKNDEDVAAIDIGYDDETQVSYKLLVALAAVTAHPPDYRELFFLVIEADGDGNVTEHKGGRETRGFLTGNDRADVLRIIGLVARRLVEKNDIKVLVINTIETHSPDKSLLKYESICHAICEAGYTSGRVNSYHGAEQWILKRI